jgi:ornithine--oxo-acid transaminase
LFPTGNFWGRTITASGACDDPSRYTDFGPFTDGFELFEYNNVEALREKLAKDPTICAVCIEPIQGEGGVIIPDDGYLKAVRDLCTEHNVLMMADEIQTGFGRTGKMFAVEWENVRPDILIVGKSLSGGMMPVSGCLSDSFIMDEIKPGDHGSTYGGNPLGMAVAHAAVKTLVEEGMVENSLVQGKLLKEEIEKIKSPLFNEIRGRGLFVGVELRDDLNVDGNDFAKILAKQGLLTKSTHDLTIRLAPPLVITSDEVHEAVEILKRGTLDLERLNEQRGNSK